MFIQSVGDNQFSATYVEDYFDSVENLPEDVQRHISHARELDISYRSINFCNLTLKSCLLTFYRCLDYLKTMIVSYSFVLLSDFLKEVTKLKEAIESGKLEASDERRILIKLDQALISLQEIGDEKVEISQQIVDLADNKYRQLDQDFRNLGRFLMFNIMFSYCSTDVY